MSDALRLGRRCRWATHWSLGLLRTSGVRCSRSGTGPLRFKDGASSGTSVDIDVLVEPKRHAGTHQCARSRWTGMTGASRAPPASCRSTPSRPTSFLALRAGRPSLVPRIPVRPEAVFDVLWQRRRRRRNRPPGGLAVPRPGVTRRDSRPPITSATGPGLACATLLDGLGDMSRVSGRPALDLAAAGG